MLTTESPHPDTAGPAGQAVAFSEIRDTQIIVGDDGEGYLVCHLLAQRGADGKIVEHWSPWMWMSNARAEHTARWLTQFYATRGHLAPRPADGAPVH